MPKYVKDCNMMRVKGDEVGYIECIYSGVKTYGGKGKLAERGMKALVHLAKERGASTPIPIGDLYEQSGIHPDQTPTCGLWPWLEAGVVGFLIMPEFYQAVEQVLSDLG